VHVSSHGKDAFNIVFAGLIEVSNCVLGSMRMCDELIWVHVVWMHAFRFSKAGALILGQDV
jgi:hypothetical protein